MRLIKIEHNGDVQGVIDLDKVSYAGIIKDNEYKVRVVVDGFIVDNTYCTKEAAIKNFEYLIKELYNNGNNQV